MTVDQAVSPSSGDPWQRFSIGVSCFGSALDLCRDASGSVDVQQLEVTWSDDTAPQGSADLSGATPGPIRGDNDGVLARVPILTQNGDRIGIFDLSRAPIRAQIGAD